MIGTALRFFRKLKEAVVPIEDQWSLAALDGEIFEEVVVERLNAEYVTFRHRVGRVRLPLALLTEESQLRVVRGFQSVAHEEEQVAPEVPAVRFDKPAKSH